MSITSKGVTILACAAILTLGVSVFAQGAPGLPVIKDFSSEGGSPANKTGPKDVMYLVKPGDKITFSVKADGAKKYEWRVNKDVQAGAGGEEFTWAVPDEKGIWEIHLTAFGDVVRPGGKEGRHTFPPALAQAHQEWVVSTLPKSEAPDLFEYFTDGNFTGQRDDKDPWDRPLKQWKANPKLSAADGFIKATVNDGTGNSLRTRTDLTVATGTWKFPVSLSRRQHRPDGFQCQHPWENAARELGIWKMLGYSSSLYHRRQVKECLQFRLRRYRLG